MTEKEIDSLIAKMALSGMDEYRLEKVLTSRGYELALMGGAASEVIRVPKSVTMIRFNGHSDNLHPRRYRLEINGCSLTHALSIYGMKNKECISIILKNTSLKNRSLGKLKADSEKLVIDTVETKGTVIEKMDRTFEAVEFRKFDTSDIDTRRLKSACRCFYKAKGAQVEITKNNLYMLRNAAKVFCYAKIKEVIIHDIRVRDLDLSSAFEMAVIDKLVFKNIKAENIKVSGMFYRAELDEVTFEAVSINGIDYGSGIRRSGSLPEGTEKIRIADMSGLKIEEGCSIRRDEGVSSYYDWLDAGTVIPPDDEYTFSLMESK